MQPTKSVIRLVRAIGAEFLRRFIKPLAVAGAVVLAVLLAVAVWLVVAVNAWWWLLLAPTIALSLLFIIVLVVARIALRLVDSAESTEQKQAVAGYVDRLERVAENLQTPQFVLLYRVVRDVLWPRQDGFIATVSRDSKSLAPDFKKLLALFD